MTARIVREPIDVGNRLEELGLDRAKLSDIRDAMVSARADCTNNDPPSAPGWSSWRMGTRRLREVILREKNWEKDETDQISAVVNQKLRIRIAVANTDDATGLEIEGHLPQNRSKKGAATDRAVQANQGSFIDALDASLKVIPLKGGKEPSGPIKTWYLCVYNEGDTVRSELSCPSGLDNGFFTDFVERIFLDDGEEGGGGAVRRRNDDGGKPPEFDVPVKRKK
jgi:hypothetical protein